MKARCALLLILLHVPPALIAQGMGKQQAHGTIEPEITSSDVDLSLRGTRLEALLRQRRWNEAGALAEETVHQSPASGSSWYVLGTVRFNQRQFHAALRALRRAEQLFLGGSSAAFLAGDRPASR